MSDWDIPANLSEEGQRAAEIIRAFCHKHKMTDTGGQKVFHDPKEWNNSEYGQDSHLVVLHEGGDHAQLVSMDYAYERGPHGMCYEQYEELSRQLAAAGIYMEACYKWHSAVYV